MGRLVTILGKVSDHPRKGRWATILEILVIIDGKVSLRKGASSWESWVTILGIEDDCPV